MPLKRLLTEFGMGSSLRRQDYTQAAERAVQDALWHNSINLAELYGKDKSDMVITVEVAVQQPDALDTQAVAAIFPYGQVTVVPVRGGLDVPRNDGGNPTVIANVAISVALDLEDAA
ncbi:MAG: Lin0512 family protein [Rhodobacteraceae bacterium]|nr:Lin0512 family protein [Paracoccaceae bacterium]